MSIILNTQHFPSHRLLVRRSSTNNASRTRLKLSDAVSVNERRLARDAFPGLEEMVAFVFGVKGHRVRHPGYHVSCL